MVNKIDRDAARPDWVIDRTFELFMDLGATDEQCDFPVVYASGFSGISGVFLVWVGGCVCGGDGEACVCVGQCVSQLFVSVDVSGTFKVCGGILGGGGVKRVRAKCFDAAVVKCACVCACTF